MQNTSRLLCNNLLNNSRKILFNLSCRSVKMFSNSNYYNNDRVKTRNDSQEIDDIINTGSTKRMQYGTNSSVYNQGKDQGQYQGNYNQNVNSEYSNNYNQNNLNRKRNRLSFLRDGMIMTFYLRRTFNEAESSTDKKEGYVFIELREYTEHMPSDRNKDPRFILLKGIALSKILLIRPRCLIENHKNLQIIQINQKNRNMEIQETAENKYLVTLRIMPKTEDNRSQPTPIISQIELNPEDLVLLQKFINVSGHIKYLHVII